MKIFKCVCSKAHIFLIIYCILSLLEKLEKNRFESPLKYINNSTNSSLHNNITNDSLIFISSNYKINHTTVENGKEVNLLYLILENIADLFAGFLVIFARLKNCLKPNKKIQALIYESIYDPSKKDYKCFLIVIISILHVLANASELIFFLFIATIKLNLLQTNWLITIDVFGRVIFCHLLLKSKLFRHHIVSIIFCFFFFFIMSFFGIITIKYEKYDLLYLLFLFISKILYALEDTINKILLTDNNIHNILPQNLMFYRGLLSSIIIIPFTLIIVLPLFKIDFCVDFYSYLLKNKDIKKEILSKILFVIINLFKTFSLLKMIYIFSPEYIGLLKAIDLLLELVIYIIVEGIKGKDDIYLLHIITNMIYLFLISIGLCVFNEIIVIYCCGLSKNTKCGKIEKEMIYGLTLDSGKLYNEKEDEEKDENAQVHVNDLESDKNEIKKK